MHEIGYALELIERIHTAIHEAGVAKVTHVKVQLGRGMGINPENLGLAFDWAKRETVLEETQLEIELIPITVHCTLCDNTYVTEEVLGECPRCGALGGDTLSGDEFRIESLEMDNAGVVIH